MRTPGVAGRLPSARRCAIIAAFPATISYAMTVQEIVATPEFQSVVKDYRGMCLWFMKSDLHPENDIQLEQILSSIESHGDLVAFKRVGRIRQWLQQSSRPKYSSGLPVCG